MLAQTEPKFRAAGVAAELLRGSADALPFPDDFGASRSALLRVAFWPLGLFEHVADNLRGRIPALLDGAGFACREVGRYGGVVAALAATPRASAASGARPVSAP